MHETGGMSCKKLFPFRVGTTSYIIPADIIPNIEYLKEMVDDVEVVLFESDEISNLPSADDIETLRRIAEEHDLTYSIHLPMDVYLGHAQEPVRRNSVDKCLRIIDLTQPLEPSAYVLHCEAGPGININRLSGEERHVFRESFLASMDMLLENDPVSPRDICVETLNYPIAWISSAIEYFGLSLTLDIGHLELYGYSVSEHLDRFLSSARVLHMHGIKDGKDHTGLEHMLPETLDMVMKVLFENPDPERVFTMEIFSEKELDSSCRELMKYSC